MIKDARDHDDNKEEERKKLFERYKEQKQNYKDA